MIILSRLESLPLSNSHQIQVPGSTIDSSSIVTKKNAFSLHGRQVIVLSQPGIEWFIPSRYTYLLSYVSRGSWFGREKHDQYYMNIGRWDRSFRIWKTFEKRFTNYEWLNAVSYSAAGWFFKKVALSADQLDKILSDNLILTCTPQICERIRPAGAPSQKQFSVLKGLFDSIRIL